MKELVVISGKGGTGKTSVVAAFASLAKRAVLADCDVDAADLHLVLEPEVLQRHDFIGGKKARIDSDQCMSCGRCQAVCRFKASSMTGPGNDLVSKTYRIDPLACEGCGVCVGVCPVSAVALEPTTAGEWFVSHTRYGPMVHARLGVAADNSGKLVSTVRTAASDLAKQHGLGLVIVDGPPGIGCPVIASLTGASLAVVVTEPTLSGLHDLERVAELTRHFGIPTLVCVNKWDINPDLTERIERKSVAMGLQVAGRLRYDGAVTAAQILKQTVIEHSALGVSEDMTKFWATVSAALEVEKQ